MPGLARRPHALIPLHDIFTNECDLLPMLTVFMYGDNQGTIRGIPDSQPLVTICLRATTLVRRQRQLACKRGLVMMVGDRSRTTKYNTYSALTPLPLQNFIHLLHGLTLREGTAHHSANITVHEHACCTLRGQVAS